MLEALNLQQGTLERVLFVLQSPDIAVGGETGPGLEGRHINTKCLQSSFLVVVHVLEDVSKDLAGGLLLAFIQSPK